MHACGLLRSNPPHRLETAAVVKMAKQGRDDPGFMDSFAMKSNVTFRATPGHVGRTAVSPRGSGNAKPSVCAAKSTLFVGAWVATWGWIVAVKFPDLTGILLAAYPLIGLSLALGLFAQGLLACCFLLLSLNALLLRLQLLLLGALKFQPLRVLLLLRNTLRLFLLQLHGALARAGLVALALGFLLMGEVVLCVLLLILQPLLRPPGPDVRVQHGFWQAVAGVLAKTPVVIDKKVAVPAGTARIHLAGRGRQPHGRRHHRPTSRRRRDAGHRQRGSRCAGWCWQNW